ncbi:DUF2706 domain-containing protein [Candidatus Sarmatiella mevalonica]|uniref:DUF2706 domain-containing protein n=1 Tax=Candidatus Sarmatiella mevalonica TaxID=2770581 RepID=UPI001921942F|nr:DUF2706 domain-containing protein [Candidatus Sarmatiella mevalonica]
MVKLMNKCFLLLSFFLLASCAPSKPYEIKSPCVSADTGDFTPCIRKPISDKEIA